MTILNWPRPVKHLTVMGLDFMLSVLATWCAYSLRLETLHWPTGLEWAVYLFGAVLVIPIFIWFGLYRAIFRYSGIDDLFITAQATVAYAVLRFLMLYGLLWPTIPITQGILQPIIFFTLIGGSRLLARYCLVGAVFNKSHGEERTLIFGAGEAGIQTFWAMAATGHFKLYGFVDEDPTKFGQTINGVPIFSALEIGSVVSRLGITDILLAIPSATREQRNRVIQILRSLPVHTRTLPGLANLKTGRDTVKDIGELDVEDLLGRDVVAPQPDLLARGIVNLTILVTGAGGTIGSELCRQILQASPRRLLLLDHSEFGLYTLHQELSTWCQAKKSVVELVPLLASVTNRCRLDWICATYQPHTVYHAAAYKHVPMVECNPSEGILNNVFGTLNMALAAQAAGVARFVLVSTDKAVRPTNLMGASKRMAELILQALASKAALQETCFSMVRFGNVLGSSGSVVPLFRKQLAHGGPLTITHPDVTRYFMLVPEAAQLVLQAAAMASGGQVFLLDMGEPVKILDLARRMVSLAGLKVRNADQPDGDIEFAFIGLRPGEKLYEELLIGAASATTAHPRIMKAEEDFLPWSELVTHLARLKLAAAQENLEAIKSILEECVPGFHEQLA